MRKKVATLLAVISILISAECLAQAPPPPPGGTGGGPACWPPPCVPIDQGLWILALMGVAYVVIIHKRADG